MRLTLGWWLVVDALATFRLTRLVTVDEIARPLRELVGGVRRPAIDELIITRRRSWNFVTCPWCVSVWAAAGVVVLTRVVPDWWSYVALALAFSAVAGLVALVANS